jgi:FtsZ-binding cell division protein ZapB
MRICIPVHPVLAGIDRLRIDEWRYIVKDTDIIAAIAPDAVSLMDKAIAEIKRLRQENATLTAERDEMRRQRDEARREVCKRVESASCLSDGEPTTLASDYARWCGWDCFKEDGK